MKDSLKKISVLIGVTALVTSSVESIKHFSSLINDNFWVVYFVALILSLIPLWPESSKSTIGFNSKIEKKKNVIVKFRWIIALLIIFLFLAGQRIYSVYVPSKGRHPHVQPIPVLTEPQKNITPYNQEEFLYTSKKSESISIDTSNSEIIKNGITNTKKSTQIPKEKSLLIVKQFELNSIKTSFIETNEYFAAVGPKLFSTFRLNPEIYNKYYPEKCQCGWESAEYDKTIESLKKYTEISNKQELNKYFSTFVNLEYIVTKHPDVAEKLIPTSNEWSKLSQEDYNVILRWVKCCVGIPYPTFIVSLENNSEKEMIVQEVLFNVLKIGQIKGIEDGVLAPTASYVFELKYLSGTQTKRLHPSGFRIPSKSTRSFEITLFTNHKDSGLCWLMNLEFIAGSNICKTKTFQLIMSGKSQWFKDRSK